MKVLTQPVLTTAYEVANADAWLLLRAGPGAV
jgi:hypothetical protein